MSTYHKTRRLTSLGNRKTPSTNRSQNSPIRYNSRLVTSFRSRSTANHQPYNQSHKRTTPYKEPTVSKIPSYIDRRKAPQAQKKPQTASNASTSRSSALLDDPKCNALREQLYDGGDLESLKYDELKQLSEHLREYSVSKTFSREYEEAKRANELYNIVREEILFRDNEIVMKPKDDSYKQMIVEKKEKFKRQLEEFDNDTDERRKAIISKQENENESFEKKWTEEMPQTYRKQSAKLMNLLQIEQTLGLCNEYDKAKQVMEEAQRLELKETDEAQRLMESDYASAKAKLDKDHQEELVIFDNARKDSREVLIAQQKSEMDKVEKRIHVILIRQNENYKPRETSLDIQNREAAHSNLTTIKRGSQRIEFKKDATLLPPLIPPNDPRVKERRQQERRAQQEKKKKFLEHMDQKQKDKDRSADHSPREDNEDANYYDMLNQLDRLARLEVQRKAEIKPREERILSQRTSRTENRSEGALEDTAQDMFQKLYTHEEDNDSETSGSLSESSLTEDIRINDDANREEGGTHAREEEDGEKNENGEEDNNEEEDKGSSRSKKSASSKSSKNSSNKEQKDSSRSKNSSGKEEEDTARSKDSSNKEENSSKSQNNEEEEKESKDSSSHQKDQKDDDAVQRTTPETFNLTQSEQFKAHQD